MKVGSYKSEWHSMGDSHAISELKSDVHDDSVVLLNNNAKSFSLSIYLNKFI